MAACTTPAPEAVPVPSDAGASLGERSAQVAPAVEVPSFDPAAVVRSVRLAYRPTRDGAFEVARAAHRVRVSREALTLTPRLPSEGVEGPAISLRTQALGRAGGPAFQTGEARVEADGALTIERGIARERLVTTELGVEQSWAFDERPAGEGDLVVRLAVEGARYLGETDGGLHFGDGGLGARYGHATWIDARGLRTSVRARFVDGAIELAVPAAVVDGSPYPAVLDPTFSAELGMDTPVPALALGEELQPAVAFDGTQVVVVWADGREGEGTAIYGTRVSTSGVVLDPLGVRLASMPIVGPPVLGFDGTSFLVVWATGSFGVSDVFGLRFSSALVPLDAAPFVISDAPNGQYAPSLAFDGTQYLVAWTDARAGVAGPPLDVFGARVSPAGVVLDPAGIAISAGSAQQSDPRVTFDGTGFFVAWTDFRALGLRPEIYGARVSSAGVVLDPAGLRLVGEAGGGPIAGLGSGAGQHLVVWSAPASPGTVLHAVRLSSTGAVLDATPLVLDGEPLGGEASEAGFASVAFDGTNLTVVWAHDRGPSGGASIYASRVPPTGALLDPTPLEIFHTTAIDRSYRPALAFDGTRSLVVWADGRHGTSSDIYAARFTPAGAVLDAPIPLSTAANGQAAPDVAFDGTRYLVVWQDARGGAGSNELDVYGVRVDAAGTVLDPAGIAISTAPNDQTTPRVVFDGTQFVVVWEDRRADRDRSDVYAARVSSAGVVLDPDGIAVCALPASQQQRPVIARSADTTLVAWVDTRNAFFQPDVYGARLAPSGAVLDPDGLRLVNGSVGYAAFQTALASDGESFLLAWADSRTPGASFDVYAARVSSAGVTLDPSGIRVAGGSTYQAPTSVAFGGGQYLVTYTVYDPALGPTQDVWAARVSPAGAVLDPAGIAISTAIGDQRSARAAFDGVDFLLAWEDTRLDSGGDLRGARVSTAGAVVERDFVVSAEPEAEVMPVLAAGRPGSLLAAYARFDGAAPYRVLRVRARVVTTREPSPLGTPCAAGSECASGHCVDGVCCESACGGGSSADCQACSRAAGAATDGRCGAVAAGRECRSAAASCDRAETCDGRALTCPTDRRAPDGTACSDGLACNGAESCMAGSCRPGTAPSCDDRDPCTEDRCVEPTGCTHTRIPGCGPDAGTRRDAGRPGGSMGGGGPCAVAGVGAQGGLGILALVLVLRRRWRRRPA